MLGNFVKSGPLSGARLEQKKISFFSAEWKLFITMYLAIFFLPRESHMALAPHDGLEFRELTIDEHDVVLKCTMGDVLRVMRNVGGGGGHKLVVKNFKITLKFDPNATDLLSTPGYAPDPLSPASPDYPPYPPLPTIGRTPYPPLSSDGQPPYQPSPYPSENSPSTNLEFPESYGWRTRDPGDPVASYGIDSQRSGEPPPPSYEDAVKLTNLE